MATRKKSPKSNGVKIGRGKPPSTRNRYPFGQLKKKDDWFSVNDTSAHASVRAQASKRSSRTGVKYSVNRIIGSAQKPPRPDYLVVTRLS